MVSLQWPIWRTTAFAVLLLVAADKPKVKRAQNPKPDTKLVAECRRLNQNCKAEQFKGNYRDAHTSARKAQELLVEMYGPGHAHVARILTTLGDLEINLGLIKEAQDSLDIALAIREQHPDDHAGLAEVYYQYGRLEELRRDLARSKELFEKCLELRVKKFGDDSPEVAEVLRAQAVTFAKLGEYQQAEQAAQKSVAIYQKQKPRPELDLALSRHMLGWVVAQNGQNLKSKRLLNQALQTYLEMLGSQHPEVARAKLDLGTSYLIAGDFAEAETLMRESLALYEATLGPDHYLTSFVWNNLGNALRETGDPKGAMNCYDNALRIKRSVYGKDAVEIATTLTNVAIVYANLDQHERSLQTFEQVKRIKEARYGKQHIDVIRMQNNIATEYFKLNRLDEAISLMEQCLEATRKLVGDQADDTLMSEGNLAVMYQYSGRVAEAESLLRSSIAKLKKTVGAAHPLSISQTRNLADLLLKTKRVPEAEELCRKVLKLRERTLGNQNPDTARTWALLADCLAQQNRRSDALEAHDKSRRALRRYDVDVLPLFSDTEQLKFLRQNDASNLYRAVSYLMEGQPDANAASQAAEWVMNGKALANELLAEQVWMTRATDQKDVAPIAAELQHVREQLAALTTSEIPDQSARLEQMERLEASRVELTAKLGLAIDRPTQAAQWVELKDIQAKVPENSVLVEFYRFQVWDQLKSTWQGQRYVVFVISGRQNVPIKLVDLGDAELMDAAVSEAKAGFAKSLSTLTETDEGKSEQLARTALVTLSDRLLRPLEQHLVGAENWLISPDSNLWLVPWSALTLASGQYTVESHATTLLVCGRQLLQKSDTVPSTAPVIVADPNFDAGLPNGYQGPKLCTPLPGSAIEARAIAPYIKDFTKAEPQVSLGDSATEQLVKSIKNPSVLVLSTHGFFAESRRGGLRHPLLRCGLTFAGANCPNTDVQSSDGILLGMEIVNTRLQGTQLVVLSACDTAVGDVQSGEGVLGLRQAFHLAGAKQVVSTLWLLTDADTAFIMTELFKELAAGKETSQALRAAQLATIKQRRAARQGAHPFFWAPYTLTGTSTAPSNGS